MKRRAAVLAPKGDGVGFLRIVIVKIIFPTKVLKMPAIVTVPSNGILPCKVIVFFVVINRTRFVMHAADNFVGVILGVSHLAPTLVEDKVGTVAAARRGKHTGRKMERRVFHNRSPLRFNRINAAMRNGGGAVSRFFQVEGRRSSPRQTEIVIKAGVSWNVCTASHTVLLARSEDYTILGNNDYTGNNCCRGSYC